MYPKAEALLQIADALYVHLDLSVEQLQASLAQVGRILTAGAEGLPEIHLTKAMSLGQRIKNLQFLVTDARQDAWGLGISLGDFLYAKAEETLEEPVARYAEALASLEDWQRLTNQPLRAVEPDPEEDADDFPV